MAFSSQKINICNQITGFQKLHFFNVKKADTGCYTCVARNKYGASSASGFIDVLEEESMIRKESFWRSEIALPVRSCDFLDIISFRE